MAINLGRDTSGKFAAKTGTDTDAPAEVESPPVGAGPGAAAIGDARAEAKAGLESRKRGPYKSKHNPDGLAKPERAAPEKQSATPSRIPPEVAAQLEAMYSPEIWEPVVEMPFAAAQLVTGHEHWGLDEKSRRVLSVSGSTAARYMGFTNPKWLAINLFLINLLTVATPRLLKELALRKMEQAKKPEPKPDATRGS